MEELSIILLILMFVVLIKSIVIVRQGYEYTVENFGMLFFADIFSFEELHSEIEKILINVSSINILS